MKEIEILKELIIMVKKKNALRQGGLFPQGDYHLIISTP